MNLSELTTLRVGGPIDRLLEPADEQELVDATLSVWAGDEDWLVIGGGSNVLAGDDGFAGTVIRAATRGIEPVAEGVLRVQAGEPWDGLVSHAVESGLSGIEALSGIPGTVGAAPLQNIGAYGQELSSVLVAVDLLDFETGERMRVPASELGLGYRTSALKHDRPGLVVAVELRLRQDADGLGELVVYPQLAGALGVEIGDRVPLSDVRRAVLALRASKGMLLDPADPDSVSAGSFFTNPIVSASFARDLPADAPRWISEPEAHDTVISLETFVPEHVPAPDAAQRGVKLSAAWLIEHSGIERGLRLPGSRAAISSKHTLALVNTGGATAEQIAELGRYIQTRVLSEFGVLLVPEPVLVGIDL